MQDGPFERRLAIALATAIACIGVTLSGAVRAQDTSVIEKIATYRGADRTNMLVEGARKEGTLTFYSSMIADQAIRPIIAGFAAKYPFMKVPYVRDDPPQMLQKLMAESRANRFVADVIESTGLEVAIRNADINRPFWSPELAAYPKEHRTGGDYWAPTRYSYLGVCYNTDLVRPEEVPQTFADLLNPKWKKKMAWSSTVIGAMLFITGVRNFMGEEKALDYLEKLSAQEIAPIASSNRTVVDRVIAGEHAICLDSFLHHPILSAKKGAPVAPKPMDPVLTVLSSVMLPKAPPHPHAAMLFIDYLLSTEGQDKLRGADYFPSHPKVSAAPELDKIVPHKIGLSENFISPEKLNAELAKSRELYQKFFVR